MYVHGKYEILLMELNAVWDACILFAFIHVKLVYQFVAQSLSFFINMNAW